MGMIPSHIIQEVLAMHINSKVLSRVYKLGKEFALFTATFTGHSRYV